MLREAELFVMAEQMTVEVLGRVGPEHHHIVVPPWTTTTTPTDARAPKSLWQLVNGAVGDDLRLPVLLAGGLVEAAVDPPAAVGDELHARLATASAGAIAAVRRVVDGDAVVHTPDGDLSTRDHLARATVSRSLLAHYVAAYLGSTACPLPEELARPLWELTAPDAARWRSLGVFGEPMPLPDHVSWRDRFLLTAGHPPHPLGH